MASCSYILDSKAKCHRSTAPEGCVQYFTGVTGVLQSFNYLSAAGLMLSNTDYTLCIRLDQIYHSKLIMLSLNQFLRKPDF